MFCQIFAEKKEHKRRFFYSLGIIILVITDVFIYRGCGVPDNIHGRINGPPKITDYSPKDASISAIDGEFLNFWIKAEDPDNDLLVYNWQLNGVNVSNGTSYSFYAGISHGNRQIVTIVVKNPAGLQDTKVWLINVTR